MLAVPWADTPVLGTTTWGDLVTGSLRIVLLVVLAVVAVRSARRVVPRALARAGAVAVRDARWEQRVRTLSGTLVSVVGVVVWSVTFITALDQLGVPLGPLLASAGVAGLAIGFGAQQLVRDVISGFFILVEDQFGVGDTITSGAVSGTVESMSLRLTRVRGDDGVLHHLRNGDLSVVSNASRGYAVATVAVPLPAELSRDEGVDRLRAGMAALVASGGVDAELVADPVVLGVTELKDGKPVVTVTARTTPGGKARVQRRILHVALSALAGEPLPAPLAATPELVSEPEPEPVPAPRKPARRSRRTSG